MTNVLFNLYNLFGWLYVRAENCTLDCIITEVTLPLEASSHEDEEFFYHEVGCIVLGDQSIVPNTKQCPINMTMHQML